MTHAVRGIGPAARQRRVTARFAIAIARETAEARDRRRLLRLQTILGGHELLAVDDLGCAPPSHTDVQLLRGSTGRRCNRDAKVIASNLPSDEWTPISGVERRTGALLDRLASPAHVPRMSAPAAASSRPGPASVRQPL
jgi:DNA replication protein DnaC